MDIRCPIGVYLYLVEDGNMPYKELFYNCLMSYQIALLLMGLERKKTCYVLS